MSSMSTTMVDTAIAPKVEMTTADSSALVKAVAALETGMSARQPGKTQAKAVDTAQSRIDSGYASINTSQSSTPDSSKGAFVNGGEIVSKGRVPWKLPSREKIKLVHFNKPIPPLTWTRFENLQEVHGENLYKLTKGLRRCRPILWTLKMLGECENTAVPWIFIQCEKAVAGRVRRFFKQQTLASDLKPTTPDKYTPSFDVYVLELPPLPLHKGEKSSGREEKGMMEDTFALYVEKREVAASGSLCGVCISAKVGGKVRSATIGGLISLKTEANEVRLVGMTAGHFLSEEKLVEPEDDEEYFSDGEDKFEDFGDDGEDFELDLASFETATSVNVDDDCQIDLPGEHHSVIGHVFATSHTISHDKKDFDWALFTIEDSLLGMPNVVDNKSVRAVEFGSEKRVHSMTATSGLVSGTLSSFCSYFMLSSSSNSIRALALTLDDGFVLKPGDSGAWVVDKTVGAVYGHIIASDVFGVAYVVPMIDVFIDIQKRPHLNSVQLSVGQFQPPELLGSKQNSPSDDRTKDMMARQSDNERVAPTKTTIDNQAVHQPVEVHRPTNREFQVIQDYPYQLWDAQQLPIPLGPYPSPQQYIPYNPSIYPPVAGQHSTCSTYSQYRAHHTPAVSGQVEGQKPPLDSGYSSMNNSPAPSPPQRRSPSDHDEEIFYRTVYPPGNVSESQFVGVTHAWYDNLALGSTPSDQSRDSRSTASPMAHTSTPSSEATAVSDPTGKSRFERFKKRVTKWGSRRRDS